MQSEEDWFVECSDDELKNATEPYEPSPAEINRLYSMLDKGEVPELNWKCPGYRPPSPEITDQPAEEVDVKELNEDKSDFDFMDETTSPKLKIRNKGDDSLKGSAKKKTTSLDGVINNMRRHNLLPAGANTGQKSN